MNSNKQKTLILFSAILIAMFFVGVGHVYATNPNPIVSCYGTQSGQTVTFYATGYNYGYNTVYYWTGACIGYAQSCTTTISNSGTYSSTVNVSAYPLGPAISGSCSVNVSQPINNLIVSCYSNPSSINSNQSTTFLSSVSGGAGPYSYSWTGACTGSSQNCTNTIYSSGNQTATLTVTSGGQTASANCSVNVNQQANNLSVSCYSNPSSIQTGNSTTFISSASGGTGSYNYSWSGICGGYNQNCTTTIFNTGNHTATVTVTSGGQTTSADCSVNVGNQNYNDHLGCYNDDVYWFDQYDTRKSLYQDCGSNYVGNNTPYCIGNSVYRQTNYITGTCINNACASNNNTAQLIQTCLSNQTCQGGACVTNYNPVEPTYYRHYLRGCYGGDVYWYDSLNSRNDVYKTCSDSNSCTQDSCSSGKCNNIAKCDGSTCAKSSPDYCTACVATSCGDGVCNCNENMSSCSKDCAVIGLAINLLGGQDANPVQWAKSFSASSGQTLDFLVVVSNGEVNTMNNVSVKVTLPSNITYQNQLTLDGTNYTGDIISGVSLGDLVPGAVKTLTFKAQVLNDSSNLPVNVLANVNTSSGSTSDSIQINLSTGNPIARKATGWVAALAGIQFNKPLYVLFWIIIAIIVLVIFSRIMQGFKK